MIDEEFHRESKVENRLRIERRGIEKKIKDFTEERSWTEKKKTNYFEVIEIDGMYPCRTEYTSNSLVSRN